MKVNEENELPEHSFIYYIGGIGDTEVKALIFEPASEDDAIKAAAADLAWHIQKARVK
jgi:hypothetical protein